MGPPAGRSGGAVLTRVGVIGDIHGEDEVLDRVLQHFASVGVPTVLAVGDMVDGVGDVNRACSLLAEYGVLAVAGNHDRWILAGRMRDLRDATPAVALTNESRAWIEHLPRTRSFDTPGGPLLLCHGLGEDDMAELRSGDSGYALESNFALQALIESREFRFVVNGHAHERMVRSLGRLTIINAGTLSGGHLQTCCVLDFELGEGEFLDAGRDPITRIERFSLV
jgi:putative phosphoesterase